jgi:hypothetical protein
MMKLKLQNTLMGMMALTQVGCGTSMFDALAAHPQKKKHQVYFENHSSANIQMYSSLAQTENPEDCNPAFTEALKTVGPGEAVEIDLETECRGEPRSYVRVELVKDYDVGVIGIDNEKVAAKLLPGFSFLVMNRDESIQFPVQIVQGAQASPDHPNPWTFPVVDSAPLAWVSAHEVNGRAFWRLNIAVPKQYANEKLDVVFPKSSGVDDFGSYPIRESGDNLKAAFTRFHGDPIWPQITSERTKIVCDDIGCLSHDL